MTGPSPADARHREPGAWGGHFLYSAASSYPHPTAVLIDADGRPVHTWTRSTDQVPEAEDPPTFLRGWNHVALDRRGRLVALVPLGSVLALDHDSGIVWRSPVAAHHDVALTPDGHVTVLAETVHRPADGGPVVLDSHVTTLGDDGRVLASHSLYDLLVGDPVLRDVVHRAVAARRAAFHAAPGPADPEAVRILRTGRSDRPVRDTLRLLRQLPGSPADVLHPNAVRLLPDHPAGLWRAGSVLVSFRDLDLLTVIDLDARRVVWRWGPGVLSGQHQPTPLDDGRILVLDNGVRHGRSRVLEIDPTGPAITWSYVADPPESFFTALAGGCERLPNGNVLVTESQAGRAFEVTRSGRRVWSWSAPPPPAGTRSSRVGLYRLSAVEPAVVAAVLDGAPRRRPARR